MKVVSLVPSLTETLVASGVEVVGRTRYCIHPADAVKAIPIVGGTKSVHWDRICDLGADLVIMDREENTREMADECPLPWFATHVTSVDDAGIELEKLGSELSSSSMQELAEGWRQIAESPAAEFPGWQGIPGTESMIGSPEEFDRLEYMIWREPWMAVGPNTFIHSVLQKVGLGPYLKSYNKPYPEIEQQLPEPGTFYLFSTEPYPFARYRDQLEVEGFKGALVDGEFYSWFGVRSYQKLLEHLSR